MGETADMRTGTDGGRFSRAVGGCVRIAEDGVQERIETVALEVPFAVSIDGAFCDVLSCTPRDLEDLAFGYAFAKGVVDGPEDVAGWARRGKRRAPKGPSQRCRPTFLHIWCICPTENRSPGRPCGGRLKGWLLASACIGRRAQRMRPRSLIAPAGSSA